MAEFALRALGRGSVGWVPPAVLFDLDGTLLDHEAAAETAVVAWASEQAHDHPHRNEALVAEWVRLEQRHFAAYRAGERIGRPPHDVFYVGDNVHTDALAATQAGLRGVWLNRRAERHEQHPGPTVDSLRGAAALVLAQAS